MAKRTIALCGCLAWVLTGCMASGIEEDAAEAAIGQDEAVNEASSALEPPFQVVDADTTFQGNCGRDVDAKISTTAAGKPVIELIFEDLSVLAEDPRTRDQKLCNVRVHVKSNPRYRLSLEQVFYQGRAEIDANGGSGTVSARAFFDGLLGIDGFKRFGPGYADNFTVRVDQGTPATLCGADTYLNLLVDITARRRSNSDGFSEIAIQRGSATADLERRPTIWCGIYVEPC